ncbi:MAG: response regulator transcription factor [Planctomycetaceae bacterium]
MVQDSLTSSLREGCISLLVITRNRLLLECLPDRRGPLDKIEIVGRALSFDRAEGLLMRLAPSILLLDAPAFLAGFRSLGEIPSIRLGQTRLAVMAEDLTDTQLEIAMACGVDGLLSARDALSDLAADLIAVAGGEVRTSPSLSDKVAIDPRTGRRHLRRRTHAAKLSRKQLDVLIQLASGRRVKDIAQLLDLSEKSVESQKYRLMNRLGFSDRIELCRWAIREGLIQA